jgi:hypothetical protein
VGVGGGGDNGLALMGLFVSLHFAFCFAISFFLFPFFSFLNMTK